MMSSGVLAFYLSESEDPELWRVMAQLTQNERTEFFKNALSYMLVPEEVLDGRERDGTLEQEYLFAAPEGYVGAHDDADAYEVSVYEDDESLEGNSASQTEWFDDDVRPESSSRFDARSGRHMLSPTFSSAQSIASVHEKDTPERDNREKDAWAQFPAGGSREKWQAGSVRRSEINNVALEDVFTEGAVPDSQNLRGLDFLLKNVIGEENDEAVMAAIRRRRVTHHS